MYNIGGDVLEPGSSCLPEQVSRAVNQAQDTPQRFTLGEMSAVHTAFVIFQEARRNIGFASVYPWPLGENAVTVEKRDYVGTSAADLVALGKHNYEARTITMSAQNWGECEQTSYKLNEQIRAWLVLHEFSHIFVKDRRPPLDAPENYATRTLPNAIVQQFGLVVPTGYATESGQERAIEAVTATF